MFRESTYITEISPESNFSLFTLFHLIETNIGWFININVFIFYKFY